jgi:hypothetical protein
VDEVFGTHNIRVLIAHSAVELAVRLQAAEEAAGP